MQFMDELQSWWEIPCIGQYVSLFRFDFKLPEMDLEELEEGLIADGCPGGSPILENLIVSLIRGYYPRAGVNEENWEFHLRRLLQKKWVREEGRTNPLQEGTSFNKITLREKVEVLHSLCYYRLESPDVPDLIKTMDADSLRVQSLGCDDAGNVYWYFYGTRLYKEEPSDEKKDWKEEWKKQKKQSFGEKKRRGRPRKCKEIKSDGESEESEENDNKNYMNLDGKSRWSVVCTTLEEWVNFTERYKNSQSKREIALFKLLSTNFLPHLNEMYEEKEKRLRQKIMELIPRRISRRIETRKRTRSEVRKSELNEGNGNECDDDLRNQAYEKERLSRDRAQRLEERNQRRISEQINRSRTRSTSGRSHRNSSYSYSNENSEAEEEEEVVYRPELSRPSYWGQGDMRFKMHQVITEVKMCKDAWPFLYPVEESYAPGYNDIIKEPIDLSTIENKLITGVYKTMKEIDNDFCKMVENCKTYNGERSEFSTMANTLWGIFRRGAIKLTRPKSPAPEPVATQSIPYEQNEQETSQDVASNDVTTSNDVSNDDSEAPTLTSSETMSKRKRKKKAKAMPGMKGLDMLLKASEMALKNVRREDSSSFSDSSSDTSYKPTSSFSDLNIVPIHSHNASKPNSPQQINNSYGQASADQQTQYDADEMQDQSHDSSSAHLNINQSYSEDSYNDSNSLQNIMTSNDKFNDSFNSSNVSNTVDIITSDQDKITLYNEQSESTINILNTADNQLSSILADCNTDNMANLLTKYIKDNHSTMDSQSGSIPLAQDVNTSIADTLSVSPRLDSSLKVGNSPPNTSQMYSSQATSFQDGLNLQLGLENYPSNEITTVDATAIGISNFYPRETNGNNSQMQYQNTYGNQVDESKKPATVASLLAATEKTTVSSPNRKQRCSPIYVTVNPNQSNLVNLASNFEQSSSEVTVGNVKYMPEYNNQQSNLVQASLTQLGNVSVPASSQNFIIQDANTAAATSVSSTSLQIPEAFNKLCPEQNTNAFIPNQLSPRQLAVNNGQIMIITQNSTQQSTNVPTSLNFLQNNASGGSYQHQMYNSGIPTQVSPTAVTVANQNTSPLQHMQKINSTRPPKKRSPMIEQLTVSPQISPTANQLPISNATCNNITYSQPMQVYASPPNSRPKLPNVHSSPELNRNSVIMPNVTQTSPTCSSQNIIFTNGGTINSTAHVPTYVSSSRNTLYPTMAAPQQMPAIQRMASYNSSNHVLRTVPFMPKVPVQNGVKRFKPTSIINNKNGQFIVISTTKDNVPNHVVASGESFSQMQQSFTSCINKNTSTIRSDAPQFININNALLQTMPIQGFPLKTAPMISEVPSNQLTQFINIPHYIVATQSPTMIQQSPIYTQTVNSTNQNQQSMDNR